MVKVSLSKPPLHTPFASLPVFVSTPTLQNQNSLIVSSDETQFQPPPFYGCSRPCWMIFQCLGVLRLRNLVKEKEKEGGVRGQSCGMRKDEARQRKTKERSSTDDIDGDILR